MSRAARRVALAAASLLLAACSDVQSVQLGEVSGSAGKSPSDVTTQPAPASAMNTDAAPTAPTSRNPAQPPPQAADAGASTAAADAQVDSGDDDDRDDDDDEDSDESGGRDREDEADAGD